MPCPPDRADAEKLCVRTPHVRDYLLAGIHRASLFWRNPKMYKWQRTAVGAALLAALSWFGPALGQEESIVSVEMTGAGTDKQQALEDAMRKAVEKGCGTYIQSISKTEEFQLCFDVIEATSAGFVQSYEMLKEWTAGDVFNVTVRAKVSRAEFEGATKTLLQRWGHPKFMVRLAEKINDKANEAMVAQTGMQGAMVQKGFVVVDEAQFEENRKTELKKAAIEGDVAKIAQIGGKMGAQVVIVGTASGSIGPPENKGGMNLFACQADVTARAVRTDTAEVVATEQISARANMRDPQGAAAKALSDAAKQLGEMLPKKIRTEAMKEIQNGRRYEVTIEGINYSGFRKFRKGLQSVQGLKSISDGTVEDGIANFNVNSTLLRDNLVDAMCDLLPDAEPSVSQWKIKLKIPKK